MINIYVLLEVIQDHLILNLYIDLSRELFLKFPYLKIILCGSGDKYKSLIKKFSSNKNVFVFGEIDKYNAKFLIKMLLQL